jgi:protein-tyrosine phosphatase
METLGAAKMWMNACIVGIAAFLAAAPTPWKSSTEQAAPRNYGVIWEHKLTRSGLPNDSSWLWVRSQSVKSVVTFLPDHDIDYGKYGCSVLRIPMKSDPPTDEQAEQFLRFIQDPKNQPVHIHCVAGQSRTGLMAALARYAIDGWPLHRALEEARRYRQGKDLSDKRVNWLREWAAKHPAGSFRVNP